MRLRGHFTVYTRVSSVENVNAWTKADLMIREGTADAFYFLRKWWTSDATATVRVQSIEQTHRWAKLGLMFRESADPGARHVMLVISAASGVAMQHRRAQPGGISSNVATRDRRRPRPVGVSLQAHVGTRSQATRQKTARRGERSARWRRR